MKFPFATAATVWAREVLARRRSRLSRDALDRQTLEQLRLRVESLQRVTGRRGS